MEEPLEATHSEEGEEEEEEDEAEEEEKDEVTKRDHQSTPDLQIREMKGKVILGNSK